MTAHESPDRAAQGVAHGAALSQAERHELSAFAKDIGTHDALIRAVEAIRRDRLPEATTVEWFVRDANGNLQGPWSEAACRADVASGKGGVQVLCRHVTELMEVP